MKNQRLIGVITAIAMMVGGCASQTKPVTFAVIADVQYADKDTSGGRYYRDSQNGLKAFVEATNQVQPDFAIHLGDLIDGGNQAGQELDQMLAMYNRLKCPHYLVCGNHDFNGLSRPEVLAKMKLERGYYAFESGSTLFVVLDTQDVAVQGGWPKDSPEYQQAQKMLGTLVAQGAANAQTYNGGVGAEQLAWLDKTLSGAGKRGQDVVVFGHLLLAPAGDAHLVWNAGDVRSVLEKYGCVRAYVCGHKHAGGYVSENGIHYLTLRGMVEDSQTGTWALITVYSDRLAVKGSGMISDSVLLKP